jgi:GNAT superfamily N-acetyltransferase
MSVRVRLATAADAEQITQLSGQLGYPATTAETLRRLVEIGSNGEHAVLVAESGGILLGWIHVVVSHSLLTERRAEIAGLVVDEQHRSRGIGQVLMEDAEEWARKQGCDSVRLHSNVLRPRAHTFYERLGYHVTKLQKAFRKELA